MYIFPQIDISITCGCHKLPQMVSGINTNIFSNNKLTNISRKVPQYVHMATLEDSAKSNSTSAK